MTPPRMVSVLTENHTMIDSRDVRGLVRMAVEAEEAGFDMVMVSDHILLGPSAGDKGRMENPRDYAMPGNQDPATPWPANLILLAAIAAATTRIRIGAIALIAPLRHPLALAKDLATLDLLSEGRLVIQPTVSWHEDEYRALAVPFNKRGKILDEHLQIWRQAWKSSPISFSGEFFQFEDVYIEPKPFRPEGPAMWFGGERMNPAVMRRLIEFGHGFHPVGEPSREYIDAVTNELRAAGKDPSDYEYVGGTRVAFPSATECAPLAPALEHIPEKMDLGFNTFCIKPSIFIDDVSEHPRFCRDVIARVTAMTT